MQATKQYINAELENHYPHSEIKSFIRIILEKVCGWSYTEQILKSNHLIADKEFRQVKEIVRRLQKYEPIQHILGETEFCSLKLFVNSSVLIPRPETEELVNWIIEAIDNDIPKILDIGTGSGCIPLALKRYINKASIFGIDISEEALKVARKNSLHNKLEVDFRHRDILSWEEYEWESYDILVSNPPYVREQEKKDMPANVLDFEPGSALFVPDEDPLKFYRRIAEFAIKYLKEDGMLFFEINEFLGKEMHELLERFGFDNVSLRSDINGKDRMISCRKKKSKL